jgi:hypothetical protein
LLQPFKARGCFLTAAEHRERHPTYFDKIRDGNYSAEAVRAGSDTLPSSPRGLLEPPAPLTNRVHVRGSGFRV